MVVNQPGQPQQPRTSDRRSPPTQRVIRVLHLLTTEAPRTLGLAEIARRLDISQPTCLGVLNELTISGYLVRDPRTRAFGVGPALVGLGRAAQAGHPSLALARKEMDQLAVDLDRPCTLAAVTGREIVVLDRAETSAGTGPALLGAPGLRFPFTAPVGVMFVAWRSDDEVREWLERTPIELDDDRVERLWSVVRSAREQGFLVERLTEAEVLLHQFLPRVLEGARSNAVDQALLQSAALFAQRDYLIDELRGSRRCSVSVLSAPIFDPEGDNDLIMSVYVMEPAIAVRAVLETAGQLVEACRRVTGETGGVDRWLAGGTRRSPRSRPTRRPPTGAKRS